MGEEFWGDINTIASSRIGDSDGELCKDDIVIFFMADWWRCFSVVLAQVVVIFFALFDGSRHSFHQQLHTLLGTKHISTCKTVFFFKYAVCTSWWQVNFARKRKLAVSNKKSKKKYWLVPTGIVLLIMSYWNASSRWWVLFVYHNLASRGQVL